MSQHTHSTEHDPAERRDHMLALWVALVPAALTVYFATWLPTVMAGDVGLLTWDWLPTLDISLAIAFDGLSLTFALLISAIGTVIVAFSGVYLAGHPHFRRFLVYLIGFMASMLGLVLADDLITLFVFWELTTITSFLLIGYEHGSETNRRNALQGLLVTGLGGLAMLAGFVLLGQAVGTYRISEINALGPLAVGDALYAAILILVLAGAFTKSAQVPFHFWLPNAMSAPTPVSAYLHSATMVKAGVYLLARMHPSLGATDAWMWTLTIVGAITAVYSSIVALRQTDLKLALAYTTVMALGTLTMLLGANTEYAFAAAVTFLVVHCLYKSTLFLVVAMVDHGAGTRDVERLGGLARALPITATVAALAACSMAGFPPFLGFLGKELMYESALGVASSPWFVGGAAVLANAMMVAVAGIVALRPFYGERRPTVLEPHEAPAQMWLGPAVLAGVGLVLGMTPGLMGAMFVTPTVSAIAAEPMTVELKLWHGVNLPLILSIVTVGLGVLLYLRHVRIRRFLIGVESAAGVSGDRSYDAALDGLAWIAKAQTRAIQVGTLRNYLLVVFAVFGAYTGWTLIRFGGAQWPATWPALPFWEWGLFFLIAIAAVVPAVTQSRLAAICALGVMGTGIAMIFLIYGAPDVAITQLLVEILVVVLVAIVLIRLPTLKVAPRPRGPRNVLDIAVAAVCGIVTTVVTISATTGPLDRRLTDFFEAESVPTAFGRNIVNVILVDFRALDTFGEIAVVAVAGLAVYALVKLRPTRQEDAS